MGRARTIARRTFLVGSVALAGGVAFGTYMVKKPYANPLLADRDVNEAVFNPWVKISPQKITLICPHTDLGQGVRSMQAMLIAEEMDLDFGQFETETGKPDPAYYNTASGEEGVPFMSNDESFSAQTMRSAMGSVIKLMGMQGTGGSSSVPDSFDKLRHAGAVARETLKLAASKEHNIAVKELKTASGAVILPNGDKIPYTKLASKAANLEPVRDVKLRNPSNWRLIGKPIERLDIVAKSTGTLQYGIDLSRKDMVHATVKTNPRPGGTLKSHDASAAEKMRGVKKIIPITNGVAVIADNTWRAIQAANAIEFDWGEASIPAEMEDHWKILKEGYRDENLDKEWRHDGDVPAAIENAEKVIEAEYRVPYLAHAPLEPLSALIKVTDDAVEIWVSHQMPRIAVEKIAAITGHAAEKINLHNLYCGGSFGHRLEFENIRQAAEIGNQMRGQFVKLTYSREEDMAHDFPRPIAMAKARGIAKDGKVDSFDLDVCGPSSVASQMGRANISVPGPDPQLLAGAWNLPYRIENFRTRAYKIEGVAPSSSWRSVGASIAAFFAESLMDEIIHEAGVDPLEERLRLVDDEYARKVLETVGEMSGWGNALGENRGRGIAFCSSFGVRCAEVVDVTNTDDGIKIDKVYVAAEVGQVVDPVNFENLVQGGVVWGLGHAMMSEITYSEGMAEQKNYDTFGSMRINQCPEIVVKALENDHKIRGIGEPPVPPAAPALANAIFAATGKRLREMPFNKHIDFV